VIACFEQTGRFIALPRGCREPLEELLASLGVALELSDERADGVELAVRFTGKFTTRQAEAMPAMLAHELGVLCAPPGIGKTVIAAKLIAARARSTLVLVHRKPLLEQWVQRLGSSWTSTPRRSEPSAVAAAGRPAHWTSRWSRAWRTTTRSMSCWPATAMSSSTSATTSQQL
jgi:superfamily II DNA or RNA helicase